MNAIDKILVFISALDWLAPTLAMISQARGRTATITLDAKTEVGYMLALKSAGYRVRRPVLHGEYIIFDLPVEQFGPAIEQLQAWGLPIEMQ